MMFMIVLLQKDLINLKKVLGGRGKSLANARQDHRFLIFKNADSWMKYQNEFGDPNVYDTMIAHTKNMSRDIAMMEYLVLIQMLLQVFLNKR